MSWNELMELAGSLAMLGWALLILLPRWPWVVPTARFLIPGVLSLGYALLVMLHFAQAEGGFGSIEAVRSLFQSDPVLLAGWVHYLAFDLFVGGWIAREAQAIGLSRLLQAPILVATFMLGPLGLALFLLVRVGRLTLASTGLVGQAA